MPNSKPAEKKPQHEIIMDSFKVQYDSFKVKYSNFDHYEQAKKAKDEFVMLVLGTLASLKRVVGTSFDYKIFIPLFSAVKNETSLDFHKNPWSDRLLFITNLKTKQNLISYVRAAGMLCVEQQINNANTQFEKDYEEAKKKKTPRYLINEILENNIIAIICAAETSGLFTESFANGPWLFKASKSSEAQKLFSIKQEIYDRRAAFEHQMEADRFWRNSPIV
jgi:hypothetical protein